ncbi:MAG: hypothetical protein K6G09_02220 [Treponema sp.]|nr:hypothetical protein [Treponema sp.]
MAKSRNIALDAVCGKGTIDLPLWRQPQTESFCHKTHDLTPIYTLNIYNAETRYVDFVKRIIKDYVRTITKE